mmetsp:Transcript_56032/g.126434  ORF Transcript_56032/g.126434 Transcript_56032/m.126434 type:complete len:194 (+) Transcript_56032:61-642(+)
MSAEDGVLPMNEVVTKVLESFNDPKFKDEVEVFVNCNIPTFAVPTQDGSHPLDWTFQHKKYSTMYESQLQKALSSEGVDITDFMTYMQQCQDAFGADPGFQSLMAALTASEDYNAFLHVMFAAVRDNWVPEDTAAPPPAPNVQMHEVDVAIPEGVNPGMAMNIEYLGQQHQVVVPDGFGPGMAMRVQLPVQAA